MKTTIALAGLVLAAFVSNVIADEKLQPQRVLYVGHRADDFTPTLKRHFTKVETVARENFKPAQADDFDVVVLDWPQSHSNGRDSWDEGVPLGNRAEWRKPTVLLGSAGLNLAVAWKLKGGSGCTCLAPVAYGLKDHEIFKSPLPIDIRKTATIPTVKQFAPELKTETMEVVPLIDGIKNYARAVEDNSPGWATHYYEFADMPDVELFSGGINSQTPRSSALWRQGNLLHFGFEQSPKQLNDTGKAMLVNAVAYISRFTEDRPIDITPSVFAKEAIGISRRRAKAYFTNPEYRPSWATNALSASVLAAVNLENRPAATEWYDANGQWLHPATGNLLEVDQEARARGTPFDSPDFLTKTISALREKNDKAAVLLERYVADGPGKDADVSAWEKWWQENSKYVFYSELGGYKWYIDPLAKRRGIPTKDLRGPARADVRK
ncbi:MAG TPA: hypothetical protein VFZ59_17110 [Verrucomicrobiae bacterium]|nr:hypothetical protein [Verrucomicrobiae bacterium]